MPPAGTASTISTRPAGTGPAHKPVYWLKNIRTEELVQFLAEEAQSKNSDTAPVNAIRGGAAPGTWVVKELVYAYAMWISPQVPQSGHPRV